MREEVVRCRVCGAEWPDKIVLDINGQVLGCDVCLNIKDADEWWENRDRWECDED